MINVENNIAMAGFLKWIRTKAQVGMKQKFKRNHIVVHLQPEVAYLGFT
jgi:hypothetical protein